jgi:protoporphyrinogen oxidase
MQDDFIPNKRFTRIYYNKHFFLYPLQPINALLGLSLWESFRCICSYIKIRLFPIKNVVSFQAWVTNRFGVRLFSIFFKTYTEKLWGIKCDQISADWASERIKGFSLSKAIFYAFFGRFFKKNKPRTIQDDFFYPSHGAGTLWQKATDQALQNKDVTLNCNQEVVLIEHDGKNIINVQTRRTEKKNSVHKLEKYDVDYLFSTMSLRSFVLSLFPSAPTDVVKAAKLLRYRSLITVNLIVHKKHVSPDHWIYVHEKEVKIVRIDNMNNFSLKMVDDAEHHTALSLEYFAFIDDPFFKKTDQEFIDLAKNELEKIDFLKKEAIRDGIVIRETEAYPVYDQNYKEALGIVSAYVSHFLNVQFIGRNGKHQYNNMDVAMISAFDAVDRVITIQKEKIQSKNHHDSQQAL